MKWILLGGGIYFIGEGYLFEKFVDWLKCFVDVNDVQVYFEFGEVVIIKLMMFEVMVFDMLNNGKDFVIVDSSIEVYMFDLLIYCESVKMNESGDYEWMVCGKFCLVGDIFGEFKFLELLKFGDCLSIQDVVGYIMVKKNWFNGVKMLVIVICELDGIECLVCDFIYQDFVVVLL